MGVRGWEVTSHVWRPSSAPDARFLGGGGSLLGNRAWTPRPQRHLHGHLSRLRDGKGKGCEPSLDTESLCFWAGQHHRGGHL